MLLLAAVVCCPRLIQAQESEAPKATRDVLGKLEERVQHNEAQLDSAQGIGTASEEELIETITSRPGAVPQVRARGERAALATGPAHVDLSLMPDATTRVVDDNGTLGLVLTGKWITDYARLIKLAPEYEKTLAGYRSQAELQKQLTAELEGVIGVKDKKIEVLNEMRDALQKRGDLYKDLADAERDSIFEKALHKLAFPAGIALGLVVGAAVAK